MFKDYYKILGITCFASPAEIKRAYREMSMKWHPDRNPNVDVTSMMQDINEAYAILKNEEKKARYNQEYAKFNREFFGNDNIRGNTQEEKQRKETQKDWDYDYEVKDDHLKEDINNAREYAKALVEEFLKSFRESSVAAVKGAATNAATYAFGWVVAGIILSLLGILIKSCN
ncbi:MAG: DnaJ domain-containing protein [Bacteroidales bacterium]|nr:DnaJ domain-containing protein [Bacteroidales bacterium]